MLILVFTSVSAVLIQTTYAQTNDLGEQITLSDDLANNPLAQEILQKIEQTKKWIAELEERNYEKLEEQKQLEEKRSQALERLNQDLEEWEALWEYYSPRNSYERFVDKISDSQVQDVFWDQFEFKEQKVKAGRDALKKVISDGGSLKQARQAYLIAAETKRIELIEANSQFNVRHNLAYYGQQILFNSEGKFVDSPVTGEQLRKYFEDYRTNPAYLEANPNDAISWEERSKTNADTECVFGEIIVYRFHASDYVCVTMETAELWIRHGMGEIQGNSSDSHSNENQFVSPITRCDDGFNVVYTVETKKYSCVHEVTANEWVEQGIAEFHDPEEYIAKSIKVKESNLRIVEINQEIRELEIEFGDEKLDLKKKYDILYDDLSIEAKNAEKSLLKDYNEKSEMSKEELADKLLSIREKYDSEKEDILKDKAKEIKKLDWRHDQEMADFAQSYDDDPYVKVILNPSRTGYEAVLRD